eukprot:9829555-Alexandrium_andersonii.AAC.1
MSDQAALLENQQPGILQPRSEVLDASPSFLPTIAEPTRLIKHSAASKAARQDGAPVDLLRAVTLQMARLAHPLVLKAFVCAFCLPGGGRQTSQLRTNAPDPTDCSAHRAVVLASALRQLHYGLGRPYVFPAYANYFGQDQRGGLPHRGPDFAGHVARFYLRFAATNRQSPEPRGLFTQRFALSCSPPGPPARSWMSRGGRESQRARSLR